MELLEDKVGHDSEFCENFRKLIKKVPEKTDLDKAVENPM